MSRQIPWGIPIPAFQSTADPSDWIFNDQVDQETVVVNGTTYRREEDTFDTWFSSGQWPFITTDYLTDGPLKRFYPTSVLETGHDILYPWVSRMIMLGLYTTGEVPFKEVYLHGLVLDEKGQKMSKSKGNVINPMETISAYGSDALRLGLIASRTAGQNQAFSVSKVVAGRNFANKLWNIARFIEGKLGTSFQPNTPAPHSLADHWILVELTQAAAAIDQHMAGYRFAEAGEVVYHTIWDSVADWFIEASKIEENLDMLAYVLDTSLKLAHPFAPFVTETIWQSLSWHDDLLMTTHWPEVAPYDDLMAAEFTRLQTLVAEARFVTAELPGSERYGLLYQQDSLIEDNAELIRHLAKLKSVEHVDQARGLRLPNTGRDAWLDVSADTLEEHQSNLEVRLAEALHYAQTLEGRLSNESYIAKAPANLVAETREQLTQTQALIERLRTELTVLA